MRFRLILLSGMVFIAAPLADYAGPRTSNLAKVIAHHLASAEHGDIDALMADYAAGAVLITPDTAITGKAAIRAVFQRLVGGNSTAGSPQDALRVQKQVFEGDVAYLLWVQHAGPPAEVHGSDTFIFSGRKIMAQTVVIIPTAALQR
jgi:ketosteroid isomerase-like protein